MTLNVTGIDFEEDRVNSIPDKRVDFVEEILKTNVINFAEIFYDRALTTAMNNLTDRQKEVIFLRYVKELEEKEIAWKLGVSVQSVNKVKNAGIIRIRKGLGGVKNGLF